MPDVEEGAIEREILRLRGKIGVPAPSSLEVDESLDRQYLEYLHSTVTVRFDGLKLTVDCGNGAACRLAPELFRRLGAEVTAIGARPNGRNINLNRGALHPGRLRDAVLATRSDFGVAFDGDADRAIFVARSGNIVDGDGVLLTAARDLKARLHDGQAEGGRKRLKSGVDTPGVRSLICNQTI